MNVYLLSSQKKKENNPHLQELPLNYNRTKTLKRQFAKQIEENWLQSELKKKQNKIKINCQTHILKNLENANITKNSSKENEANNLYMHT